MEIKIGKDRVLPCANGKIVANCNVSPVLLGPCPCVLISFTILKVCMVALFDKEEIHQDLHLVVAESQDESKFVVYGEMYVSFVQVTLI